MILTIAAILADLIPVSSTVIPLNVYEVSYGSKDGKLNEEEYKKIYMKNMPKKAHSHHQPGMIDKLVTGKLISYIHCSTVLIEIIFPFSETQLQEVVKEIVIRFCMK